MLTNGANGCKLVKLFKEPCSPRQGLLLFFSVFSGAVKFTSLSENITRANSWFH